MKTLSLTALHHSAAQCLPFARSTLTHQTHANPPKPAGEADRSPSLAWRMTSGYHTPMARPRAR
jgi:hypothetical protein